MERVFAVVGGGISGLTCAYHLRRALPGGTEDRVLCLEASARPGGKIRTGAHEGYLCEYGPTGFLDNAPETLELVRSLELERELVVARAEAARRYLFVRGRLRPVPTGPLALLRSRVLSWRGKLRLLAEPFVPPRRDGDESVYSFARRRLGEEAARVLVDALVAGVYAADLERLSVASAFPRLQALEREAGSLVRGMLRLRGRGGGPAGPRGRLTSFRHGMEQLTRGLARALGEALRTEAPVEALERNATGYRLRLRGGEQLAAETVVLAVPARAAARLVRPLDEGLAELLQEIPAAPLTVVHLGYPCQALPRPLDGFGFLVPRIERDVRILGCLWPSSIFPGRAREGRALLTVMVGGARDPEMASLDDDLLTARVREDLRRTMGIESEPEFVRIVRHPEAIAQYEVGHRARLERLEARLERLPGLVLCGASYRGVSVNDCIRRARECAAALVRSGAEAGRVGTAR